MCRYLIYHRLMQCRLALGDLDAAEKVASKGLSYVQKIENQCLNIYGNLFNEEIVLFEAQKYKIDYLAGQAGILALTGNFNTSVSIVRNAAKQFHKLHASKDGRGILLAKIQLLLAATLVELGEFEKAQAMYQTVEDRFAKVPGGVYRLVSQDDQRICFELPLLEDWTSASLGKAAVYRHQGELQKAIGEINQALDRVDGFKNTSRYAAKNLASIKCRVLLKKSELYHDLRQWDQCRNALEPLLLTANSAAVPSIWHLLSCCCHAPAWPKKIG